MIFITGTAPIADDGSTFAPGDAYAQTKRCFEIIEAALNDLGAGLSDVVRTRMFITDFGAFDRIADAHREIFAEHPPGATMVEVAALVHDDMIIEIEVEAVC
jgi:isochorismate pyruvate lyase